MPRALPGTGARQEQLLRGTHIKEHGALLTVPGGHWLESRKIQAPNMTTMLGGCAAGRSSICFDLAGPRFPYLWTTEDKNASSLRTPTPREADLDVTDKLSTWTGTYHHAGCESLFVFSDSLCHFEDGVLFCFVLKCKFEVISVFLQEAQ